MSGRERGEVGVRVVLGEGTSPSQEREGKERAGRETGKREGKK